MKIFLLSLLLAASPFLAFAQGDQQEIARDGATEIHIYGNMSGVFINTGGTNTIEVNHVLTVEGEDRPDLRKLEIIRDGSMIKILEREPSNELLEEKVSRRGLSISHRRDGDHLGGNYGGVKANAYLEVTIPAGMKITVESLYGGIEAREVKDLPMAKSIYGEIDVVFAADAKIDGLDYESNYQSVDVTLPASVAANLRLSTSYGSLYTDFDFTVPANGTEGHRRNNGHGKELVKGSLNGGGRTISLTSPYKNVYLRKRK